MPDNASKRDPAPGVLPMFVERWSPRAFADFVIDQATMVRLLDAARWSPSCFNAQPWRFYTSSQDSFNDYLELLVEKNQVWAKRASVIGFLVGKKHFEHNGKPNPTYAFDCGSAWMAMTLQAHSEGLCTHGMAGIHHDKVAEYFSLDSENEEVLMGFAIGKLGDPAQLEEDVRAREFPSLRKPLAEIWPTFAEKSGRR
ncbi:hypothetical protein G8764_17070 [Pseudomaricurvus alcaniphilus]|uniref:nitroreductase family protein n=1 Tax=Pseudomaricurvus alcaniphilus TaxID=1166482 RepID=UPI001409DCB1|nr:nitroreductase family protein [Pseudomaricurvus alcaniphilus]NHN39024.1 hypothetical protein [Pseudomaricurvus alcaniphilus]